MARRSTRLAARLADRSLNEPHPDRLPLDTPHRQEVLRRHDDAMTCGAAGYVDPATGLFVITAKTHAERGRCCGNGCRHCPFV